jgi:ribosomal protein S18 acetylase RimI-like enzyme
MTATTFPLPTADSVSDGMRPVSLKTDLAALADLIEICFADTMDEKGREIVQEMRAISKGGHWLINILNGLDRYLGSMQMGYVWIEGGRLVGNVTLSTATLPREMGKTAILSNVAVYPEFRGRGIARELVTKTLSLARSEGFQSVILQVDQTNRIAQKLYESLGFQAERTFTQWRRASHHEAPNPLPHMPRLWLRPADEWNAEYHLANLIRPNTLGGLGWLRPVLPRTFRSGSWFSALFGPVVEPMVIYADDQQRGRSGLIGVARIRMAFGSADRIDLLVHPLYNGRLEAPLINYSLRRLEDRRRAVLIEHPADDLAVTSVFRKYQFDPKRTLTHMRLQLGGEHTWLPQKNVYKFLD